MTDTEDSWGDADVSGAEGLDFDDEFGMADPSFDTFKPPKADVFLSVLDLYRDRKREEFIRNIQRVNFSPPVPEECKRPADADISREESPEKQRQAVTQTYKDFLQYKRTVATSERLKEFQGIGRAITPPARGYHSFSDKRPTKESTRKRALSFGDEGDRTLDMSGLLKPEKLFDDEEEPVCKLDVSEKDKREAKVDYLVDDQYYPGLIDDAVNRKVNFYQIAFDCMLSDSDVPEEAPEAPPISLVEAFDIRVGKEQGARKKIMKEAPPPKTTIAQQELAGDKGKSFVAFLKDYPSPARIESVTRI